MDIESILRQMPLEDKIALCSGATFWETKRFEKYGVPALFMCDGPHGLRKQENAADMLGVHESRKATCFPSEVTMAGSWDVGLLEQIGAAIGEEAREQGVGLVLGPGANLKRDPLCGRNFEYFSEDPYLAGKLAAGFIRGAGAQGVGTSLKHFAANSQEYRRFTSDSVLDERALRELYLTAFEIAVREGKPSAVMCAYPRLNGVHCSDNRFLLTGILRDEWGFEGMVVTDWGAMNDRVEGCRIDGKILLDGQDICGNIDVNHLRKRVGMVFQKPNPFPMSIYDNIAFGPRTHGIKSKVKLDEIVERSLRGAAIWDETKDRLKKSALGMSGGQQQRLCIARALAVEPEVLLLDEPTSALDPISTSKIEDLVLTLKNNYTIIIVTHNMQQAARIADKTAFFLLGNLVEFDTTDNIFTSPKDKRTEDYITGRFG